MTVLKESKPVDKAELVNFPDLSFVKKTSVFLEQEVSTVENARDVKRDKFFGVAFSGGGIRSGIFCLGVMQKLAAAGIFKNVDYLSTVSGGGYIGTSLAWWLTGKTSSNKDETKNKFDADSELPWGTKDPDETDDDEKKILSHTRNNGNYLTPGDGITLLSGIAIVLRAVLLNLLVWIPIVAAVFIAMHAIGNCEKWVNASLDVRLLGDIFGLAHVPQACNLFTSLGRVTIFSDAPQFTPLFKLLLILAIFAGILYVALSIQFSLLSWSRRSTEKNDRGSGIDPEKDNKEGELGWGQLFAATAIWLLILFLNIFAGFLVASIIGIGPEYFKNITFQLDWLSGSVNVGVLVLFAMAAISLLFSFFKQWLESKEFKKLVGGLFGLTLASVVVLFVSTLAAKFAGFQTGETNNVGFSTWILPFVLTIVSVMLVNYRLGKFFRWICQIPPASMRYSGRRSFEKWASILIIGALALVAVGVIPLVHLYIYSKVGEAGGGITGLLGVLGGALSAYWGFYQSQSKSGGGRFTGPILKFGAAALLFGLATLSFDVAERVSVSMNLVQSTSDYLAEQDAKPEQNIALVSTGPVIKKQVENAEDKIAFLLFGGPWQDLDLTLEKEGVGDPRRTQSAQEKNVVQVIYLGFLAIAIITGVFTNLNYISLGRFYRDRLLEAFMPDFETACGKQSGAAGLADKFRLSDVWKNGKGPYPLINANVVLARAKERRFRQRGGASFLLSPIACGSDATGWLATSKFDDNEMTLATAMAISGAAANPRTGVGGKGITRSKTISLVMNLLNFRLGYWVNNPCLPKSKWKKWRPNHFFPSGWYAALSKGYAEDSHFSELSDGGHFENLGLYELVRRRCGLIIICDGGQDKAASYSDFVTAIRRVEEDFGAKITFDENAGPANMIAKPCDDVYPSDAEYADKGYFVAEVAYNGECKDASGKEHNEKAAENSKKEKKNWAKTGLIIYLKTTMIRDLSMKAKGYKGANPDFPDQSTGDQFFDEEQFEAYRELGYRIADQMIGDLDLETDFNGGRPAFDESWKRELLKRAAASHKETGYQSTRRSRPVRLRRDQAPV